MKNERGKRRETDSETYLQQFHDWLVLVGAKTFHAPIQGISTVRKFRMLYFHVSEHTCLWATCASHAPVPQGLRPLVQILRRTIQTMANHQQNQSHRHRRPVCLQRSGGFWENRSKLRTHGKRELEMPLHGDWPNMPWSTFHTERRRLSQTCKAQVTSTNPGQSSFFGGSEESVCWCHTLRHGAKLLQVSFASMKFPT